MPRSFSHDFTGLSFGPALLGSQLLKNAKRKECSMKLSIAVVYPTEFTTSSAKVVGEAPAALALPAAPSALGAAAWCAAAFGAAFRFLLLEAPVCSEPWLAADLAGANFEPETIPHHHQLEE
eukprot:13997030-Alexandrium_andersonii.AAC.1